MMHSKRNWLEYFTFGHLTIEGFLPNVALLLLRIYAGYTIMIAGLDKLPLTDWMTEQVASIGFPYPATFAWIASWGEFAFGCLLLLGLLSRFSGFILAIIMGVASFAFQKVIPLGEMHIAQHFFWIFFLFFGIGGGKFSFDHYIQQSRLNLTQKFIFSTIPALITLFAIGLFLENGPKPQAHNESDISPIENVNIAGNFNDWDPSLIIMKTKDSINYSHEIQFNKESLIKFKFTANQSWDINLGASKKVYPKFPLDGKVQVDENGNTNNIRAYIPEPGNYIFKLNLDDLSYSVDSISNIQ